MRKEEEEEEAEEDEEVAPVFMSLRSVCVCVCLCVCVWKTVRHPEKRRASMHALASRFEANFALGPYACRF